MTRALYASLLRLHPPSFRRQFGGEMLWTFDQARVSEGTLVLLLDLFVSIARQWLMRSGVWKVALAMAGAVLQVTAGGVGLYVFNRQIGTSHPGAPMTPFLSDLVLVALWSVGMVFVMVFAAASWVTRFNRRRLARGRR